MAVKSIGGSGSVGPSFNLNEPSDMSVRANPRFQEAQKAAQAMNESLKAAGAIAAGIKENLDGVVLPLIQAQAQAFEGSEAKAREIEVAGNKIAEEGGHVIEGLKDGAINVANLRRIAQAAEQSGARMADLMGTASAATASPAGMTLGSAGPRSTPPGGSTGSGLGSAPKTRSNWNPRRWLPSWLGGGKIVKP